MKHNHIHKIQALPIIWDTYPENEETPDTRIGYIVCPEDTIIRDITHNMVDGFRAIIELCPTDLISPDSRIEFMCIPMGSGFKAHHYPEGFSNHGYIAGCLILRKDPLNELVRACISLSKDIHQCHAKVKSWKNEALQERVQALMRLLEFAGAENVGNILCFYRYLLDNKLGAVSSFQMGFRFNFMPKHTLMERAMSMAGEKMFHTFTELMEWMDEEMHRKSKLTPNAKDPLQDAMDILNGKSSSDGSLN